MDKAASRQRIRVHNFDPDSQAHMWLSLGPEAAIKKLTGMLRVAVLLGDELVLDRNDLLDGVYFLALGPEGVAEELGLHSWEALPILLLCQPPASGAAGTRRSELVERQIEHVDNPKYWAASSALAATFGPHLSSDMPHMEWVFPTRTDNLNSGLIRRFTPWCDVGQAQEAIRRARNVWVDASRSGLFEFEAWKSLESLDPYQVKGVSTAELDAAAEALSGRGGWSAGRRMDAGSKRLLLLRCALTRQKSRINQLKTRGQIEIDPQVDNVLEIDRTTTRKEALGAISELFADELDTNEGKLRARSALDLWSRAYNQTLAWKDELNLLTFDESRTEEHPGSARAEPPAEHQTIAESFGLVEPTQGLRERLRKRARTILSGTRNSPRTDRGGSALRLDGTVLRDAELLTPSAVRQIRVASTGSVISETVNNRSRAMRDLTVQIQDLTYKPNSHADRMKRTSVRLAVLVFAAIALAAIAGLQLAFNFSSSWAIVFVAGTVLLTIVSSFPWQDLRALRELRPRRLSAVLDIREDK